MATPVRQRVQKRRDAMRAAGLRPVQLWLPDTRDPAYRAELSRQIALINESDRTDVELQNFMEAALSETLAELEREEAEAAASKKQ